MKAFTLILFLAMVPATSFAGMKEALVAWDRQAYAQAGAELINVLSRRGALRQHSIKEIKSLDADLPVQLEGTAAAVLLAKIYGEGLGTRRDQVIAYALLGALARHSPPGDRIALSAQVGIATRMTRLQIARGDNLAKLMDDRPGPAIDLYINEQMPRI
ncbi:hypothetical protein HNP46_006506 [Pseudomonas nitritireducens]|uniref:Uncharacterized protein n=1 Tax=Pseudomonas nitroreducens TaxID=46680 RepID=A0A7W7P5S3_PSENT|nr:hypothetical protein [Pseudomonas nitritireducens]MBB4867592.1 hypothetical protein [Pseudomonas nitritireducens]